MAKKTSIAKDPDARRDGESLLDWRSRIYEIPKIFGQPIDNNVKVWRLPPLTLSRGGLIIPEDAQSPNVRGVLLAMGPRAMDCLISNGIDVGHIVVFSKFAGWEREENIAAKDKTPEHRRHNHVLNLKDKDIIESDDLFDEIRQGHARYTKGVDGRYCLERRLLEAPKAERRKKKLLALANNAGTPEEAETARRIANGIYS